MLIETIARRYAKALFEAALAQKCVDTVKLEIGEFIHAFQSKARLRALWESPIVHAETKKKILRENLPKISSLTLNFLFILIRKRRERLLEPCAGEYEKLLSGFYNQVTVDVRAASPVSQSVEKDLKTQFSKKSGKRVELNVMQDPALLGGMVIQMGDKVMDGSLRARLESLRKKLLEAPLPV